MASAKTKTSKKAKKTKKPAALPVVRGFRFAGLHAGIKPTGALDAGLIVADHRCATAAVFTRNIVRAAPVEIAEARVSGGTARAILVNSGNANACTGKQGEDATQSSTAAVAEALECDAEAVLPASTGVIGQQLPKGALEKAAPKLVAALDEGAAAKFAEAILTTDRGPKTATATFRVGRRDVTVLGIAKGAGMIHPNMATTLAFVVTDAKVSKTFLKRALKQATNKTFNRMTVDGDTSTNDTIVAMASGAAHDAPLTGKGGGSVRFQDALIDVLESLGKQIVADGEGAERLVRIEVSGLPTDGAAEKVARTIATSQLVKTALHGADPNWGRIMGAAGRAGVKFDPALAEVRIGDVVVFEKGAPVGTAKVERDASKVMNKPEYDVSVKLGTGDGKAHYWTCDLGHEYVRINADYRS